jgi:two-component system, chemotaxis family, sensor kinase CheA
MSGYDDVDEIVSEFLIESYENLEMLDRDFVDLEKDPESTETLARIFRTFHTIKGTSGFLDYKKLESLTHSAESLLGLLRDGHLRLNAPMTTVFLSAVDAVRGMLTSVETTGKDGDNDFTELVAALNKFKDGDEPAIGEKSTEEPPLAELTQSAEDDVTLTPISPPADTVEDEGELVLTPITPATIAAEQEAEQRLEVEKAAAEKAAAEKAAAEKAATEKAATEKAATLNLSSTKADAPPTARLSETRIRVDVGILDKLMNLAGELVLARNQILQFAAQVDSPTLNAACQGLNLITSELQEEIMKTRMQPINSVWKKLPRVVRDLAKACGKQVRLEMDGKDTDLDRTIIEAIKDPLTHLVRNAIDHGVEPPDERIAAGKTGEGTLRLRAYHEGGQVNIEISDDGKGMDPDKIGAKAVEKGLITGRQVNSMLPEDLQRLVFLPGFSTAAKVTNVSGRGVGMDVVKTNIERIGGAVDIKSKFGHGTTFQVTIPLTLAIVPALLIRHAGVRYAIQQVNLVELFQLSAEAAGHRIENIHGCPVYRLRGTLLPIIYLDEALTLDRGEDQQRTTINIVVLQVGQNQFGLVVDAIEDTTEIVVKPLSDQLKDITAFSGATILGDGTVGLILDVPSVAQTAGVLSTMSQEAVRHGAEDKRASDSTETLLLINSPDGGQMAIPLAKITRLEVFQKDLVEAAGDTDVIQYGGEILPLRYLRELVQERRVVARDDANAIDNALQVVVFTRPEGRVGLVVDNVIDVVQEIVLLQDSAKRRGILGSAIIFGKVTEFLDLASTLNVQNLPFKKLHEPIEQVSLN